MTKKKTNQDDEPVSFERSFEELQQIVTKLENGNLPLGDSLIFFETGVQRLRECYQALNDAEQKIKLLVKLDDDGNLVTQPFEIAMPEKHSGSTARPQSPRQPRARQSVKTDDGNELF
jgi:exodeoxyribonuclease VII small subunit